MDETCANCGHSFKLHNSPDEQGFDWWCKEANCACDTYLPFTASTGFSTKEVGFSNESDSFRYN